MQAVRGSRTSTTGPESEPSAPRYTARAIKGTALLDEMRALLRAWHPAETPAAFRARVGAEDLLGKATASRRDDLVRLVFERRFLLADQEPAISMRRLLDRRGSGPWFSQLCLLAAARADAVVRDTASVFLSDRRARSAGTVSTPDLMHFLEVQEARGYMAKPWSLGVRKSVAQHVLHQLTELGVLGAPRRGVRPLLAFAPSALSVAWLACDLHRRGTSDAALVAHPDWQVWQLQEHDVRETIHRLSDIGLWLYQGAGSTVRIAWTWSDWDEALKVLEGTTID